MNKKIKYFFDYGNIKKEHLEAVEEVIRILNDTNQNMTAELLKKKFKIKEGQKYDISLSVFLNLIKKHNISHSIQGYICENDVEYPIINISEDVRKLDKFIIDILNQIKK